MNVSPLTIRRLRNFRANKRGYYSALIFSVLFLISIFAEFIANDKPIFVVFDSQIHFPVFEKISETYYGGEFDLINLMIVNAVTDFPDPLSPTIARHSPLFIVKLLSLTASTVCSLNSKVTFKFFTSSKVVI